MVVAFPELDRPNFMREVFGITVKDANGGLSGFGPKEGSRPLLRSEVIGGLHAWRDARCTNPCPFISMALAEGMQAEGITGAAIFPIEEI